jgi:integrase
VRTERVLTAAAINRPLALLRHLLRLAHEEWEVLAAVPKIRLEKEPQGRIRWLEAEEEARLLAACAESLNKSLSAIVPVALETGLRKSELLDLTWDRLDMTRGVIRALSTLPGPHEGRVWPAGSIRTAFENAVTEAKLEDFHFHDLRHTFASRYVMRGGSLPAPQQILGHATLQMTMRYSHLSPKHLGDEMARTEREAVTSAEPVQELVESGTSSGA